MPQHDNWLFCRHYVNALDPFDLAVGKVIAGDDEADDALNRRHGLTRLQIGKNGRFAIRRTKHFCRAHRGLEAIARGDGEGHGIAGADGRVHFVHNVFQRYARPAIGAERSARFLSAR